jgi:hypothetical protein
LEAFNVLFLSITKHAGKNIANQIYSLKLGVYMKLLNEGQLVIDDSSF